MKRKRNQRPKDWDIFQQIDEPISVIPSFRKLAQLSAYDHSRWLCISGVFCHITNADVTSIVMSYYGSPLTSVANAIEIKDFMTKQGKLTQSIVEKLLNSKPISLRDYVETGILFWQDVLRQFAKFHLSPRISIGNCVKFADKSDWSFRRGIMWLYLTGQNLLELRHLQYGGRLRTMLCDVDQSGWKVILENNLQAPTFAQFLSLLLEIP